MVCMAGTEGSLWPIALCWLLACVSDCNMSQIVKGPASACSKPGVRPSEQGGEASSGSEWDVLCVHLFDSLLSCLNNKAPFC